MIKVRNLHSENLHYRFVVVHFVDGEFWYWGSYNNEDRAAEVAHDVQGIYLNACFVEAA